MHNERIADYERQTGRKVAGLRGDTRADLDLLLLHELMGTGIGRSAFIKAAVEFARFHAALDDDHWRNLVERARHFEGSFPMDAPVLETL